MSLVKIIGDTHFNVQIFRCYPHMLTKRYKTIKLATGSPIYFTCFEFVIKNSY